MCLPVELERLTRSERLQALGEVHDHHVTLYYRRNHSPEARAAYEAHLEEHRADGRRRREERAQRERIK